MFHIPAHKNVKHPAGQVSGAPTKPLLNVRLGHFGPVVEIIDIPAPAPKADFEVDNQGSIFLLRPLSTAAYAWAELNLPEDAMHFGDSIVIEHRYIGAIVEGIVNDGLAVI